MSPLDHVGAMLKHLEDERDAALERAAAAETKLARIENAIRNSSSIAARWCPPHRPTTEAERDDAKKRWGVEAAFVDLLECGLCFMGRFNPVTMVHDDGIYVYVFCSDLFEPSCSDAEPVRWNDVGPLHQAYLNNAVERWCCLHRGSRPHAGIEAQWRADGLWDAELEALPRPQSSVDVGGSLEIPAGASPGADDDPSGQRSLKVVSPTAAGEGGLAAEDPT
jgi:hypothetical protein